MKLNTAYITFNGEVNAYGIGSPAIFLRLQGCHLRCYKKTFGVLCDTPESLKNPKEADNISDIAEAVYSIYKKTNVSLVTLTGGDPLNNHPSEVISLLKHLTDLGFRVSVETSGTIDWTRYLNISPLVTWVIDYKLKSAGIKDAARQFTSGNLIQLCSKDYIKFVIYDNTDLEEAIRAVKRMSDKTEAILSVGAYWGGKLEPFEIFKGFQDAELLDAVTMNFQVHKMALASVYTKEFPKEI